MMTLGQFLAIWQSRLPVVLLTLSLGSLPHSITHWYIYMLLWLNIWKRCSSYGPSMMLHTARRATYLSCHVLAVCKMP
jgi:hypothetical protein